MVEGHLDASEGKKVALAMKLQELRHELGQITSKPGFLALTPPHTMAGLDT